MGKKEPENIDFSVEDYFFYKNRTFEDLKKIANQQFILDELKRTGIYQKLLEKDFNDLKIEVLKSEPEELEVKIFNKKLDRKNLLIEIKLKIIYFNPTKFYTEHAYELEGLKVIYIDWLCLQNPYTNFDDKHKRLPGQDYPGLGISKMIAKLLINWTKITKSNALINIPQYYHNASLYSKIFKFYSPFKEGKLQAMMRDLSKYELADVSFAIDLDCLRILPYNLKYPWIPDLQIHPISDYFLNYFESDSYKIKVEKTKKSFKFRIDWNCYYKKFKN